AGMSATVVIEAITPQIEGGRYPIKRAEGENVVVEADIFKDGHDIVSAVLKWRKAGEKSWHETAMTPIPNGNDRWRGELTVSGVGRYEYTIEAWGDVFLSWQDEVRKKVDGGLTDLKSEALEGARILRDAAARAKKSGRGGKSDAATLAAFAASLEEADASRLKEIALDPAVVGLVRYWEDRSLATTHE